MEPTDNKAVVQEFYDQWSAGAVAEGDFVVCHNNWSGTYGGKVFRGMPASPGRRFSVEHVHIYRLTEGRIAEHWVVRDDLAMTRQIGAISE